MQMKDICISGEIPSVIHCKSFIHGAVVQVRVPNFYLSPFREVLHKLSYQWHASPMASRTREKSGFLPWRTVPQGPGAQRGRQP